VGEDFACMKQDLDRNPCSASTRQSWNALQGLTTVMDGATSLRSLVHTTERDIVSPLQGTGRALMALTRAFLLSLPCQLMAVAASAVFDSFRLRRTPPIRKYRAPKMAYPPISPICFLSFSPKTMKKIPARADCVPLRIMLH
jgi:hypothetical protein